MPPRFREKNESCLSRRQLQRASAKAVLIKRVLRDVGFVEIDLQLCVPWPCQDRRIQRVGLWLDPRWIGAAVKMSCLYTIEAHACADRSTN